MIALRFSEFYKGNYDDHGYQLYIIKDAGGDVMYIGISRMSIWHRWFGGSTSHMGVTADGKIFGSSHIGQVVEGHLPDSWNWTIELWTREDCLKILLEQFGERNFEKINMEEIESHLIRKFHPLYNVMHSGEYHEDPLSTKKLDGVYKKLFG